MPLITNLQNPLMSADNEKPSSSGGQSPPPESQSSKQLGAQSSGKTSTDDSSSQNEETLKNLPSNPEQAALDKFADAKTGKPGKPLDGL